MSNEIHEHFQCSIQQIQRKRESIHSTPVQPSIVLQRENRLNILFYIYYYYYHYYLDIVVFELNYFCY